MNTNNQYSQEIREVIRMFDELENYPLLIEKLAQTTTFKDFQNTLKIYVEDCQ